jgi:hypothetical protein
VYLRRQGAYSAAHRRGRQRRNAADVRTIAVFRVMKEGARRKGVAAVERDRIVESRKKAPRCSRAFNRSDVARATGHGGHRAHFSRSTRLQARSSCAQGLRLQRILPPKIAIYPRNHARPRRRQASQSTCYLASVPSSSSAQSALARFVPRCVSESAPFASGRVSASAASLNSALTQVLTPTLTVPPRISIGRPSAATAVCASHPGSPQPRFG